MGCWNETCAISNLPICSGDKVKWFLLVPNFMEHQSDCYPSDNYHPFTFPITGQYNDYGGLENIVEDWNLDRLDIFFNDQIKAGFIKVENSDKKWFTIYNIIDEIHNENVYFLLNEHTEDEKAVWKKAQVMMVLDEMYYNAIDLINKHYSKIKEDKAFMDRLAKVREYKKLAIRKKENLDVEDLLKNIKLLKQYLDYTTYFRASCEMLYESFMDIEHTEGGEADIEKHFDDFCMRYIQFKKFNKFLTLTRKAYTPQCGKGSQCDEYKLHKDFAKTISKFCDEKLKEDESWEG